MSDGTAGRPHVAAAPGAPFTLDLLRQDHHLAAWLDVLAACDEPEDLVLPAGHDLVDALLDLAVPHAEVAAALAARPEPGSDAEWLVHRTAAVLLQGLGDLEHHPVPPPYPHLHPFLRWAHLLAMVLVAPRTGAWWAQQGVPAAVVRATLADVGRQVTHVRRRHGHGGLCVNADWLALHARGRIVQLGRLQWERLLLPAGEAAAIAADGGSVQAGDHAVGVHVPDYCGPFTPADCDASTARARDFLATHLPDEQVRVAVCRSWLFDPALEALAPSSNTAAFRARFRHLDQTVADDGDVLEFVFGRREDDLAALPQRTSLERLVVTHLRAGGHWRGGVGWHPWPPG